MDEAFSTQLRQLLDRLLPVFEDSDDQWRARTLVVVSSLVYVSGPIFMAFTAWRGEWAMTVMNACSLLLPVSLVLLLRWTRSPAIVAGGMGVFGIVAITMTTLEWDGTGGAMLPWLSFMVLLLVLAGGRKVGALFAVLSAVVVAVHYWQGVARGGTSEYLELVAVNGFVYLVFAVVTAFTWDVARQDSMRNAEASAEQLRDAQHKALVAERLASVGTLATGVAHEINTPLTYLTLTLEQLATQSLDPAEVRRLAREALEGGRHMKTIVAQLQSFARSDVSEAAPVPVARPVEAAMRMLGNQLRQDATLEIEVDPAAWVSINEGQLAQVLVNLLQNALHAVEQVADAWVRVEARIVEDTVEIDVSDNGSGIEMALQQRIFDPFFTTKPVGTGTGLGLSICRGILEGVGGQIRLDSSVGAGTTFTLSLPRVAPAVSAPTPAPTVAVSRGRLRILVIDDDPQLGRVVRRALSGDHEVTVFTSASDALERVDAGYDVVVCDVMMPEMPGWAFHAGLEAVQPELAGHTLFMTGGVFTTEARAFVEAHQDRLLPKPFTTQELTEAIFRVAGMREEVVAR